MKGRRIALIGFGEVGQTLATGLIGAGAETMTAYDLKFHDDSSSPSQAAVASDVVRGEAATFASAADIVISAVTAAQTLTAAKTTAANIRRDALFLDLNSASPSAKLAAAEAISKAGGRYVEAAIMSPIQPGGLAAPILLGGSYARDAERELQAAGFSNARFYSETPGKTAALKLCRSVMIKGMEALICESLIAARHYGVEKDVLASLSDAFSHNDWPLYARYMISRTLLHGRRRAEEMQEAAETVREARISPLMSLACAVRQHRAAAFSDLADINDLPSLLDAILDDVGAERPL